MLKVSELIETLIGEEPYAGFPCFLIRLSGCNLACNWCDTQAKNIISTEFTVDTLVRMAIESRRPWVLLTGGEPLIQQECPILAFRLLDSGMNVLVETNGTMDISILPKRVIKSVDNKTPSSGHADSFNEVNLQHLSANDALKFVIADHKDFDWAIQQVDSFNLWDKTQIVFSPVSNELDPTILAQWIIQSKYPIRLSTQFHKLWQIP
ncbi:radical SAM protein [bacterium]|nr:radical SAM protein [bacterium]